MNWRPDSGCRCHRQELSSLHHASPGQTLGVPETSPLGPSPGGSGLLKTPWRPRRGLSQAAPLQPRDVAGRVGVHTLFPSDLRHSTSGPRERHLPITQSRGRNEAERPPGRAAPGASLTLKVLRQGARTHGEPAWRGGQAGQPGGGHRLSHSSCRAIYSRGVHVTRQTPGFGRAFAK